MAVSPLDRETYTAIQPAASDAPHSDNRTPVFDSVGLLQGGREILIRHGDACYRLRHTRNDKLILTK